MRVELGACMPQQGILHRKIDHILTITSPKMLLHIGSMRTTTNVTGPFGIIVFLFHISHDFYFFFIISMPHRKIDCCNVSKNYCCSTFIRSNSQKMCSICSVAVSELHTGSKKRKLSTARAYSAGMCSSRPLWPWVIVGIDNGWLVPECRSAPLWILI